MDPCSEVYFSYDDIGSVKVGVYNVVHEHAPPLPTDKARQVGESNRRHKGAD